LKGDFHQWTFYRFFVRTDDFCKVFEKVWRTRQLADGKRHRHRSTRLSQAEVMTILILYHQSGYKNLKALYLQEIVRRHHLDFRSLTSYNRFVELQRRCVMPLFFYLLMKCGDCTGISFIDATSLKVCHNLRISQHRTFRGTPARDKSSTGWYYGFKLHLAINECGAHLRFLSDGC
jgi:hypothetical protein